MVSWGHRNVVVKMILPVIFIIKSITLSCLINKVIIIINIIIIIIIITAHAGVMYLQPPGRGKVIILHFSDFFEFKSIQHLNRTQISGGVDRDTESQNRMMNLKSKVRNTENSELNRYCQKEM